MHCISIQRNRLTSELMEFLLSKKMIIFYDDLPRLSYKKHSQEETKQTIINSFVD